MFSPSWTGNLKGMLNIALIKQTICHFQRFVLVSGWSCLFRWNSSDAGIFSHDRISVSPAGEPSDVLFVFVNSRPEVSKATRDSQTSRIFTNVLHDQSDQSIDINLRFPRSRKKSAKFICVSTPSCELFVCEYFPSRSPSHVHITS